MRVDISNMGIKHRSSNTAATTLVLLRSSNSMARLQHSNTEAISNKHLAYASLQTSRHMSERVCRAISSKDTSSKGTEDHRNKA